MVDIKGLGVPTTPQPAAPDSVAPTAAPTSTAPTGPVDSTSRVTGEQAALEAKSTLGAPPVPEAALNDDAASGASSFASQLQTLGPPFSSTEALLSAFLKLQILDATQSHVDQALVSFARSTLLGSAHDAQSSDRLEKAGALHTQADGVETQADQSGARAESILNEAGISRAEVEVLYKQSLAAGGDGSDIAQRWKDSRPEGYDPDTLGKELAAINKAMPHAQQAESALDQAGSLREQAGALEGNYSSGLMATATIRAGTPGYQAMLRSADFQQEIAHTIATILGEERGDKKAMRRARVEVDEARNDVARLVLTLVDKHQMMNNEARRTVGP